jgi:hypothetical protein
MHTYIPLRSNLYRVGMKGFIIEKNESGISSLGWYLCTLIEAL